MNQIGTNIKLEIDQVVEVVKDFGYPVWTMIRHDLT
jgi:hypothetical protein